MTYTPCRRYRLSFRALAALLVLASGLGAGTTTALAMRSGKGPAAKPATSVAVLPAPGGQPLQTALLDPTLLASNDPALAFARIRGAGASAVRIILYWKYVAPGNDSKARPTGFDPANPFDPAYQWANFDRQVRLAVQNNLQPIASVVLAPAWAEDTTVAGLPGTRSPDPKQFGVFARAAAKRYSGKYGGLPRIRFWQAWNEPNFSGFLNPQSPVLYRALLNAFSDAVHLVHRDNTVIAGGVSPFGFRNVATPPLTFMRQLLCLSAASRPAPTCRAQARFDVWSDHPYTTGGPTHHATNPGDVSLGDLPEMRKVLEAAIRTHHIVSRQPVRFWVTEFSWDSSPPDPIAVPSKLHARWVAEALYRMWKAGVSLVTWFQLRDDPLRTSEFQSGLYLNSGPSYTNDKPKLALRAFRFPFVALGGSTGVSVWGRTPWGLRKRVTVQRQASSSWKTVAILQANGYGVFAARLPPGGTTSYRARLATGETSLPFSLVRPPDRYYWPFGCGGILACTPS